MTRFEELKNMDIEALAKWIDENGQFDGSPWITWWDENYCSKCPSEHGYLPDDSGEHRWYICTEFSWCELNGKCKFFPEMDEEPELKDIIKMWLESDIDAESVNC